jgi:hypothetical protein
MSLTYEEWGLVQHCRSYRGLPVDMSTWFYWMMFIPAAAVLGFGLIAPLGRWASAGVVPRWDHLLSGAFGGAMILWFWFGITQQAAKAHKLAVVVDKLASMADLPSAGPNAPGAAADGGAR